MTGSMAPQQHWAQTTDGRRLQCFIAGSGPRLVVCEAGLGMSGYSWFPVMRQLADQCTVVSYNRSGIGGSEADPHPRTLARLAGDLHSVIASQNYTDLVLVGHSWGGPIVRQAAASANLQGLRGLVLVDPTDEALLHEFKPITLGLQRQLLVFAARIRVLRQLLKPVVRDLPEPERSLALRSAANTQAARESAAELRQLLPGLRQLAITSYPDAALTLLTGALQTPGESRKTRNKINAVHAAAAAAAPGMQLVKATKSGHLIPFTEPELIARTALQQLNT